MSSFFSSQLPLVLFCAVMSTALCAPRGDIPEEEGGRLEAKPRYVEVESLPSIKKIVDKVKDIVDLKKGVVHKLKKPVQIVKDIKNKIKEEKDHRLTKVDTHTYNPSYFAHKPVYETVPCVYYPQFDLHYTPPLPYYYY
ncbi:hypothetical protein EVAR_32438_1 [Eumeta japonica]|uniref:Uncharacterized protein n=1 Tax=Eumeta variegata TaxID=151549 RepID=A0A4C1VP04_EUMVA|nr:hypothetical protein EVAR_32438_1 [Eumeta japonica]